MDQADQRALSEASYHLLDLYIVLKIYLIGHCIATWYAMSRSLVKLTEIGTSCVCVCVCVRGGGGSNSDPKVD